MFKLLISRDSWHSLQHLQAVPVSLPKNQTSLTTKSLSENLSEYDDLKGIQWEWQAVDGVMTKAPFAGAATGANPTDRGKQGTKRSLLTDGVGIPLALVVDGANRHDVKLLSATLDGLVISRPEPTEEQPQHLCLDACAGYFGHPFKKSAF